MLKQAHIYIIGDVVGVGFRAWAKIQAKLNNVKGWIRNEYDKPEIFGSSGGVEAFIQGEEKDINSMIDILSKGPPISYVSDIQVHLSDVTDIIEGFEIKR